MHIASRSGRKYGNKPTVIDGVRFDSAKEARRYRELLIAQRAGEITGLECQPSFALTTEDVHGRSVKICTYKGDFRYRKDGLVVVEDVKSAATRTPVYRLKKKLMNALLGIEIVEI